MVNSLIEMLIICDKVYFDIFFPEGGKALEAQRKDM